LQEAGADDRYSGLPARQHGESEVIAAGADVVERLFDGLPRANIRKIVSVESRVVQGIGSER
jgi:hypothetical protein